MPPGVPGYTVRDVARLLGLSPAQVRGWAELVDAKRGPRREYRFTFQDLVLLRAAKHLVEGRVPKRRIRAAIRQLRDSLPEDQRLSELEIGAEGERVVVHDGSKRWNPESGQLHFNFEVAELARKAAPMARRQAREARDLQGLTADDWYAMGCDLESPAPAEAREAYRRALELHPGHDDAHVNLGRLLHEAGELEAAEAHYRAAPDDATARFNLGVVLEDRGQLAEARAAYEAVLRNDPENADAHYNAAGLCERLGDRAAALAHLNAYRRLTVPGK